MTPTYIEKYTVQASDIDENQHMNNIKYVEWVQEISKRHWLNLVTPYGYDKEYFWVVINHNIDYKAAAHEGEEIEIKTYVEKLEGVYSYRRVIITNLTLGKKCMSALTKWCLLSAESKRICRIPEKFYQLMSDESVNGI